MKCSVCKKEFGTGEVCQHCGADKFTALGNYNGYEAPAKKKAKEKIESVVTEQQTVSPSKIVVAESTICYACGEIIPTGSKFCPYCSCELLIICPKCGKSYSSQFPVCSECGTNRKDYIRRKKEEHHIQKMRRKQERERQARELERQARELERQERELERQERERQQRELEKEKSQRRAWRIRAKLEYRAGCFIRTVNGIIFIGILLFTFFSSGNLLLGILLSSFYELLALAFFSFYSNCRTSERIEQWKKENPNHRATPYL